MGHQPPPRPRHWVAPAGPPITAALEQLYEGLLIGDESIERRGANVFCSRLLQLDQDRVPRRSRHELAQIANLLAARDPLLKHTGRRMAARLAEGNDQCGTVRLSSRVQAAAASSDTGSYTATLSAEPFEVTATVRTGGRLTVVVAATLSDEQFDTAVRRYGVVICPLTLRSGSATSRLFVPLDRTASGISGVTRTRIHGDIVDLAAVDPPIGIAEALTMPTGDILDSLTEVDRASTRAWLPVAAAAPIGHPLRAAIDAWKERFGL